MRSTTSLLTSGAALTALVLSATEARPCGGAFGYQYTLEPEQNIVVSYRDGIETYVFNPKFCGKALDFGLILPIPDALSSSPAVYEKQLYTDLAEIAAPTIETKEACRGTGGRGGTGVTPGTGGSASNDGGTNVIETGTVGIFDYALLQANSLESFADWLEANGFPYESGDGPVFNYYVEKNWYFVAFKVSAGADLNGTGGNGSGEAGGGSGGALNQTICGDFGPISLSFPVEPNPVIPARIAAVNGRITWTVYTLADSQLRVQGLSTAELRFSGAIAQADVEQRPEVAKVAEAGTRLTEIRVSHGLPDADLLLEPDPDEKDYRRVETQIVYVTCSGGSGGSGGTGGVADRAGAAGSSAAETGGTPISTGGRQATGGQSSEEAGNSGTDAPSSGGTIGTGGVVETGGTPMTPTGGVTHTAPTGGTGGTTGGAPEATGGTEVIAAAGAEGPSIGSDDGGDCSCKMGGSRTEHTLHGLVAAALALAAAGGRRRQRRPG